MSQDAVFQLHVTVHTLQGVFSGHIDPEPMTELEALRLIELLQKNTVNNMRLVSAGNPRKRTVLTKAVLENSVFTFELTPVAPPRTGPMA